MSPAVRVSLSSDQAPLSEVQRCVTRVLRLAAKDVFYIETVNSRYRLEVRVRERALEDASSG